MSDVREVQAGLKNPEEQLGREMDRISLEQALKDVEIANARVTDLTQRVIELQQALKAANDDLRLLGGINRTRLFAHLRTALQLWRRWKARG
jgi:hypothetical protein